MQRIIALFFILLIPFAAGAYNEDTALLSFSVVPAGNIPIGYSTEYFTFGGGVDITGSYRFAAVPLLSILADIGFNYIPIRTKDAVGVLSAGAGVGFNITIIENLTLYASGLGGYYYCFLTDGSGQGGGNIYFSAGLGAYFTFAPAFSLGANFTYTNYLSLYHSLGFSLAAIFHIPLEEPEEVKTQEPVSPRPKPMEQAAEKPAVAEGAGKAGLEISDIEFSRVFPVLFKYYDTHPVGKAVLRNHEADPISGITVEFFVERYMDNPKKCPAPAKLEGGEEAEFELYALFGDQVLEITEGTKVSAKIILNYTLKGEKLLTEHVETLRM